MIGTILSLFLTSMLASGHEAHPWRSQPHAPAMVKVTCEFTLSQREDLQEIQNALMNTLAYRQFNLTDVTHNDYTRSAWRGLGIERLPKNARLELVPDLSDDWDSTATVDYVSGAIRRIRDYEILLTGDGFTRRYRVSIPSLLALKDVDMNVQYVQSRRGFMTANRSVFQGDRLGVSGFLFHFESYTKREIFVRPRLDQGDVVALELLIKAPCDGTSTSPAALETESLTGRVCYVRLAEFTPPSLK